ncbi:MAG: hypothetical protein NUV51_07495 [Sulfuricaulis sp.]|nr:hypothetical protein [Sulfuricaulis sp.]
MSVETLLVILLIWTVAGTLAAFAFGKAMRAMGAASYDEELLPTAPDNVRYFQRHTRKAGAKRVTVARTHNSAMKQAVG